MSVRRFAFELKGTMPALIHADDVMAADELSAWRSDPANKEVSVRGDDRSPPWTWQSYLYHDGVNLVVPQENIMACIRKASERIPKGKGNFKALSQVGLMIDQDFCELLNNGRRVPVADFEAIKDRPFADQFNAVRKMGMKLLVKRAKVNQAKHVRVRLLINAWSVRGSLVASEAAITDKVLEQMFAIAGRYIGLFDWRPGSPKSPGPYGMFSATLTPTDVLVDAA